MCCCACCNPPSPISQVTRPSLLASTPLTSCWQSVESWAASGAASAAVPADWILTEALYQGTAGDPAAILKEMEEVADYREKNQPIRERTGGSTFKNPPGHSAWKLIDEAGCRGLRVGGAKVSEMHCNFLINDAGATAEDIERLGETVRARVKKRSTIPLQWEIIRLGEPLPGCPTGEALAQAEVI